MASTITTSIVTGGSNSHATVSSEANATATDFVAQGVLGSISNSSGVGPGTGSFGVSQNTGSDMAVAITGSGNTTSGASIGYIQATPTSQDKQVLRARMTANYTGYTINSNATGSTVYDWIYLKADPTKLANPDAGADDPIALFTSRSTSNASDNGSPPTYGILLAVVTVVNGATAITNANVADKRTQASISSSTSNVTGWNALNFALTYATNNGAKEFTATTPNDLQGLLSPGVRLQTTRSITPPTQCMSFTSSSSQYVSKASPTGLSFTAAYTIEAWVYLLSYTGTVQTIIRRDNGTSHGDWALDIDSGGQVRTFYQDSSGNNTIWDSNQSLPLNQWVHVAAVVSSVSSKTLQGIYINGASVPTTNTSSSATSLANAGTLAVGGDLPTGGAATGFFNGYISEVRVWSAAQSAASIQNNMAVNLVGSETNLVALYQGNGNFTDATSNANTLVQSGGAIATQANNPYNAIEYLTIIAVSYSNPTTTLTLDGGTQNTLPNQTLNTPFYSTAASPFGLPSNLKRYQRIAIVQASTATASTSPVQLPGMSLKVTVPAKTSNARLTFQSAPASNSAAAAAFYTLWDGVNGPAGSGSVQIDTTQSYMPTLNTGVSVVGILNITPTAGSHTYSVGYHTNTGTLTHPGSITAPAKFIIECDL